MRVVALLIVARALSELSRSINMSPHNQAANPNGHAYNNSFLATTVHLSITGQMSNIPVRVTIKNVIKCFVMVSL